jgi:hypothetical protein
MVSKTKTPLPLAQPMRTKSAGVGNQGSQKLSTTVNVPTKAHQSTATTKDGDRMGGNQNQTGHNKNSYPGMRGSTQTTPDQNNTFAAGLNKHVSVDGSGALTPKTGPTMAAGLNKGKKVT